MAAAYTLNDGSTVRAGDKVAVITPGGGGKTQIATVAEKADEHIPIDLGGGRVVWYLTDQVKKPDTSSGSTTAGTASATGGAGGTTQSGATPSQQQYQLGDGSYESEGKTFNIGARVQVRIDDYSQGGSYWADGTIVENSAVPVGKIPVKVDDDERDRIKNPDTLGLQAAHNFLSDGVIYVDANALRVA